MLGRPLKINNKKLKEMEICKICKKEFTLKNIQRHIRGSHKFSDFEIKEYYDKYYKKEGEGICPISGNNTEFKGIARGYSKYYNSPEVNRKKFASNSLEFMTKVKELNIESAKKRQIQINQKNSNSVRSTFRKNLEKNPKYLKEMSRHCKEFWIKKGNSEKESIELAKAESEKNRILLQEKLKNENKDWFIKTRTTSLDYWILKGFSEEEARQKLKDRQNTFSLEKCIIKYGEEEGRKRWIARQKKWNDSYCHNNFSKISQELFWEIFNRLSEDFKENKSIFFATLGNDKKLDTSGKNNEYRLSLSTNLILPDFLILEDRKIIEFDGSYWHGNGKLDRRWNSKREDFRDSLIINNNYFVYHVQEKEYINNKELVIKECLNFINE